MIGECAAQTARRLRLKPSLHFEADPPRRITWPPLLPLRKHAPAPGRCCDIDAGVFGHLDDCAKGLGTVTR